jgi:hypothetical protein
MSESESRLLFQELEWAMKTAIEKLGEIVRTIPGDTKHKLQHSAGENLLWEMNFTAAKCKRFEKEYTGLW